MTQQEVQMFFEQVASKHKMIGGDVCGECSKDFTNPDYYISQRLNGKMNAYLMECFEFYSQRNLLSYDFECSHLKGQHII